MSLNWKDWPVPFHSSEAILEELAERFEYHDDDILVNTYPKCGTTLTQEIVSCLVLGLEATRGTDLKARSPFLDIRPPPGRPLPLDASKTLARPRVMKTHLPPAFHVRHLLDSSNYGSGPSAKKGPLNVIVMRNPKDVAVSAYYQMKGSAMPVPGVSEDFAQFWRDFLHLRTSPTAEERSAKVHDFFDFNLSWWSLRNHPRVIIIFYEELLRDKPGQIARLADFLGVRMTEELLLEVLEVTSFSTMQANPLVNISLTDPAHWRPGASFIRKGEIGDWTNHFTVADNLLVDRLIADRLAGSDLVFQFE